MATYTSRYIYEDDNRRENKKRFLLEVCNLLDLDEDDFANDHKIDMVLRDLKINMILK